MKLFRFFLMLFVLAGASYAQVTPLIENGSTWRYLDDGSDQGVSWRAIAFDDSAWASGPAQLGYGDGDEATITGFIDTDLVAAGVQRNATTYFRKSFSVANPAAFLSVRLSLTHDDAGAVFINGTEVARTTNLVAAAAFDTFATSGRNETAVWVLPTSVVVAGVNTIAVEIHQSDAGSSDVSFDLQLLGVGEVTRGPYLQRNNESGMTVRWRTTTASDSVVRFGTTLGALTSSVTDATVTTDHKVRVDDLLPDTKYFYSVGTSTVAQVGDDADHFFFTAPIAGTDRAMRVWVLGDAGTADSEQRQVRDAYYGSPAYKYNDMVLLLGDNAYNTGTDSEYQAALFDMYPTVLRQSPVWSCLGNHETAQVRTGSYSGVAYFDIFSFPTAAECGGYASGTERYFSWDYGNVHFISLDVQTTNAALRTNMLAWLENDLAANTRRWTIALWHHPPYTKGSHNSDTESQPTWARTFLVPMLEDAGVDLVLCGHSHCYERSKLIDGFTATPTLATSGTFIDAGDGRADGTGRYGKDFGANQGTVYVVAGSSGQATTWVGGSTALFSPAPHPVMHHSELALGSLIFDIDGNRLEAKFINGDGVVTDYFTIDKGPLVTVSTPVSDAAEYGPVAGQFSIARSGSTAAPLSVLATIGGTAPGTRYAPITVPMTIPAGAASQPIHVTPMPDAIAQGAQTVTLASNENIEYRLGPVSSGIVTITDAPAGAPPIAEWRLQKFGSDANNDAIRSDNADPDFDGTVNLFEYAFGLEPLIPSISGLPASNASGDYLTLSVQKNPAATDVTFTVQVNDDLANGAGWSPTNTTILQNTATLLEVRDNTPITGTPARFIRLQVTRP